MGNIPGNVISEVVRRTDVVRLFGRYTRLEEKGGKYWGLCPFHNEKTPSFSVEVEEGLYYCFGCKEGGNVFTLLEKLEGLEFIESLEQLAADAGVDLAQYQDNVGKGKKVETHSLRKVNELSALYYRKCLEKASGSAVAREYLKQRGIEDQSLEKWRIGFAPDGWDNIVNFTAGRGIDPKTVELAGLIIPRRGGSGYYDRFRNRLIFPVCDRNGRVIGFGGRALDDEQDAKYLNSPETPVFSKRSCFYGLEHSRSAIRQSGSAVIVEGYTDVIMAHQYGFENVIAVLGTALTDSHAGALSKLCEKVVLLFDSDEAGQKSAEKSIRTLLAHEIEPHVALLPQGADPCDVLTGQGPEEFKKCLESSEDFLKFCLKKAGENDIKGRSKRIKAFQELAELVCEVKNEVRREVLVREIANELNISPQNAFDYLGRISRRGRYTAERGKEEVDIEFRARNADRECLGGMLKLLLVNPQYQQKVSDEVKLDSELFEGTPECELLAFLLEKIKEKGPVSESDFLYMLNDGNKVKNVREAVEKERKYATGNKEKRLQGYIEYIKKQKEKAEREREMKEAENEEQWLKKYVEMRRKEEDQK